MGYDGPDVIGMLGDIERTFGVVIGDAEAETVRSMGDLYALVLGKVGGGRAQVCVTSSAFYRLRRAFGELFAVPREGVRTTTRLEDLLPVRDRRRRWQQLRAWLGAGGLPPLLRPAWLSGLLAYGSVVSLGLPVLCVGALHELGYPAALCWAVGGVGLLLGVLAAWTGYRVTTPWAVRFPLPCGTMRDLVYGLAGRYPGTLVSDQDRPSDAETWSLLCAIVGGEFEVKPETLTPASRPW
jgi:hypothetical protein